MRILLLRAIVAIFRAIFAAKADLAIESLALRQQLIVLKRTRPHPWLRDRDRHFRLCLARSRERWRGSLLIVTPETVIRWHRQGFKYYRAWKSRNRGGQPAVSREVRELIRRMSRANPLWGAPRIHGELLKLGIDISQTTAGKYMGRPRKPPSPTRRAFRDNHVKELVSFDFFTVPTVSFRVPFVFLMLSHHRRRILHFNVTAHPSAEWTGRQRIEAFPCDIAPHYLTSDRDGIHGYEFSRCVRALGIEQVKTARRSPWQKPGVERVIGSIRRVCLGHVIVVNENRLCRGVRRHVRDCHRSRTHLSLQKDSPGSRPVEPPENGRVAEYPELGGLYHRYTRQAA